MFPEQELFVCGIVDLVKGVDATALAKVVEEQEGILVPADSPLRTVQDFIAAWKADPAAS